MVKRRRRKKRRGAVHAKAYRRPKRVANCQSAEEYELQGRLLAEGVEPEFLRAIDDEPRFSLSLPARTLRRHGLS